MVLTEAETRDLIEQVAQGNQRAFQELCSAYEKRLFRAALKILGNHDIAAEVTQDVLLAIWKGSKRFRGDCQPFTWMWAIVWRKAMGALRDKLRASRYTERPDDSKFIAEPELDIVICDALKKLSPEQRLVVILTYYLNFSQYHTSRILQCPVGTVKSRLSTALKQLREIWNARDGL